MCKPEAISEELPEDEFVPLSKIIFKDNTEPPENNIWKDADELKKKCHKTLHTLQGNTKSSSKFYTDRLIQFKSKVCLMFVYHV